MVGRLHFTNLDIERLAVKKQLLVFTSILQSFEPDVSVVAEKVHGKRRETP